MSLNRLTATNIRCIANADVYFHPRLNLFLGENGSGKTSLLESIAFLEKAQPAQGKPFKHFVKDETEVCTVYGEISGAEQEQTVRLGVERSREGRRNIRINGAVEQKTSSLAKELPVLYLGPETLNLLTGPPNVRRKFLNWGVFHVEQSFSQQWIEANRILKQRNVLLRDDRNQRIENIELRSWTEQFVKVSEFIDNQRKRYTARVSEEFIKIINRLLDTKGLSCEYKRGWNKDRSLIDCLTSELIVDKRRGFTHSGFHRAELKILKEGVPVTEQCSRGELKLMAWALILAQGKLYSENFDSLKTLVYLVDDITSELDAQHRMGICKYLSSGKFQIFSTGVDEVLSRCWGKNPRKEFHVKHGTFKEMEIQN